MPRILPPFPTRVALLAARKVAGNPADFVTEPDFHDLVSSAWWALKNDQWERMERARVAATVRDTFPDDAA